MFRTFPAGDLLLLFLFLLLLGFRSSIEVQIVELRPRLFLEFPVFLGLRLLAELADQLMGRVVLRSVPIIAAIL